jgi:membrane protease YdiL (CAAX protease family)
MTELRSEKSSRSADAVQGEAVIRTFLVLTLAFSAVFYALIIASGHVGGGGGRYGTGIMWCPGLAALVTCRIHAIRIAVLGWHWAGFRYQAASYLLPAGYALVAYVVIWGTHLGSFPNPTFLRESVAAVGIDAMPVWAAVMLMVLLNAVYGFIRSCANALGEEIGWRGFLTPQLVRTQGFTGASLITGCIWAVWHYPILLFADYNLGTPGWYAVSCFTVMVIGMSVICTWFRLKTGSLWTATFLHASHNLFVQAIFTPLTGDTGPTRYAIDEFGFVLPLVIGATAVWFWRRREVALAAWRHDFADGRLLADQHLQPSAAGL